MGPSWIGFEQIIPFERHCQNVFGETAAAAGAAAATAIKLMLATTHVIAQIQAVATADTPEVAPALQLQGHFGKGVSASWANEMRTFRL